MLRILNISYILKYSPKMQYHFDKTPHPYQSRTKSEPSPDMCHFLTFDILSLSYLQVSAFWGKKHSHSTSREKSCFVAGLLVIMPRMNSVHLHEAVKRIQKYKYFWIYNSNSPLNLHTKTKTVELSPHMPRIVFWHTGLWDLFPTRFYNEFLLPYNSFL